MLPPKATPDRKDKICNPIIYSTDMPRLGQNIFTETHAAELARLFQESMKDSPDDIQEFINEKYWDLL